MKIKLLYLLVAAFILFFGCDTYDSNDLNQDKIRTDYKLSFDAGTGETNAKSEFRFGNDYVELSSPANITFNNIELQKFSALGITWYRITLDDSASGTFKYTNQNGDVFTNFAMVPEYIQTDSAELSVTSSSIIHWQGEPIKSGEKVTVNIKGDNDSFKGSTIEVNATSITLRAGELSEDLKGLVNLTLIRSMEPDLTEATPEGGSIITEYISTVFNTTVED